MEHLETIKLLPDPSGEDSTEEHLEIELLRDDSVLIIRTPQQTSFQISKEETAKLIAALQRGLVILGLIVLLGSCFALAETNKVIVKTSSHNNTTTVVDVGPAVRQDDGSGGNYEIAGMHGWVIVCNNDRPSCHMPHTGDSGYIVDRDKEDDIYTGENVKIRWGNNSVGIYALRETY
jgi:hypothetical protein